MPGCGGFKAFRSLRLAACYGSCDGLDEASCRADDACQLGYLDGEVWGCWELNPTQVADGDCATLEAVGCTTRNDCVPHYANVEYQDWGSQIEFERCDAEANEPSLSCANVLCEVGTHCEMRDDTGSGPCEAGNDGEGLWGCFPMCIPNAAEPGACYGDAGDCISPNCPEGTMAGIKDGCYTGYCIPVAACESAPACESITNEAGCVGRVDCAPFYIQCDGPDCELEFAYCGTI